MAITLTDRAFNASLEVSKQPNIVLQIDGVDEIFGALPIKKFVRIGDTDLEIGDPDTNPNAFFIGGFNLVENQNDAISFEKSTTTIRQQLQIDRGKSSSIPSFQVTLIDENGQITELITPDETQSPAFDLLGRACRIRYGFENTAYPDDYITIFRGMITNIESGAGYIKFIINAGDNKKRKTLFKEGNAELNGAITAGATSLIVDDSSDFLEKIDDPSTGSPSANFETYIRIDDEIIKYQSITGNTFNSLTRAQFGTTAASHDDESDVSSFYQITGNVMDVALQLMLSGFDGPFVEDVEITNFEFVSSLESIANTLVFKETDIFDLHGIVEGDLVTTTGASNGANNVSLKPISLIETNDNGDTIVTISGVTFVEEKDTSAVVSFRSQYDVYPDGMKMRGDEVDIAQHLFIQNTFLPANSYDFRLTEAIDNGKDFLEEQVYSPNAAFSIPRSAKASVGYHIGPIPGQNIKTLNQDNIKDPAALVIKRSTDRYFYNEIQYRFDKDNFEDRFLGGDITINQDSKNRISQVEKTLKIDAEGMRSALSAKSIASQQASRRLSRYKFGAENIDVETLLKDGVSLEIGDIVLFDGSGLQISDTKTGSRDFQTRLMEIENKSFALTKGNVALKLVDTNFDGQQRFGLISPSSLVKTGLSTTQFVIKESFGGIQFGENEFRKWAGFVQPKIRVHSPDFTTRNDTTTLVSFSGNQFTVSPALSFTPVSGDIIELDDYSAVSLETQLVFAFISDTGDSFNDGTDAYVLL